MESDAFSPGIIVFVVALVAWVIVWTFREVDPRRDFREFSAQLAGLTGFHSSFEYLGANSKTGIALDIKSRSIWLYQKEGSSAVHSFNKIVACEVIEDGALIGGISTSARTNPHVQAVDLRLIIDDLVTPVFVVHFLNLYEDKPQAARNDVTVWYSRLRVIIERGGLSA